ncbi:MAG: TfoX/Sxy family DNA transformation protein [Alphaproteobacteria bacterium]|nr:TfoX/Sxy family DNA transformation protein [Alphaproteobacteria bacterium]MCW5739839.1 TfoX/Sxy family DNA transformation protein [Alphaproteobacteria bacterium]
MNVKSEPFAGLPNLGIKIVSRLRESGIVSIRQLARIGPANAYRLLCERAGKRLPRCYYLYSLEGALRGIHWSALTSEDKRQLRIAADEQTARRPRSERTRAHPK